MQTLLKTPIITEKAIEQMKSRWYTFEVHPRATKYQVKQTVQQSFPVTVYDIVMFNRKGKTRRVGKMRRVSSRSIRKFARVKIGEKQMIDVFTITPESTK